MKLSLAEKYGTFVLMLIILLLSWQGVTAGLQNEEAFRLLFPLNWPAEIPYVDILDTIMQPYEQQEWWVWLSVIVTASVWMFLYFLGRGAYYYCKNLEGTSMWTGFIILGVTGFIVLFLVLRPVFAQLSIWWLDWDTTERYQIVE